MYSVCFYFVSCLFIITLGYSEDNLKSSLQLNFPAIGWTSFSNLYCYNSSLIYHTMNIKLPSNTNLSFLFGPYYSQLQPSTSQKLRPTKPKYSHWMDVLKIFEMNSRPIADNIKYIYHTKISTNDFVFKNPKIIPDVSLMIFDSMTPFMSHFFHFLEHIIPIYYTLVTQDIPSSLIKNIIFPNSNYPEIIGTGKKNLYLIKSLFPKAIIIDQSQWAVTTKKHVVLLHHVLTSDRGGAHYNTITSIWNKMMAPMARNILAKHKEIQSRLFDALHLSNRSSTYQLFPALSAATPHLPSSFHNHKNKRIKILIINRASHREMDSESLKSLMEGLSKIPSFEVNVIILQKFNFRKQLHIANSYSVLIGTHAPPVSHPPSLHLLLGMGLSHLLWLQREPGLLVEVLPPRTYMNDYQLLAASFGYRHFAWDAELGYWYGSELLLSGRCPDSAYRPYGDVAVKTYKLRQIEVLIKYIIDAATQEHWPYTSLMGMNNQTNIDERRCGGVGIG